MNRRGEKRSGDEGMHKAGGDGCTPNEVPERPKPGAPEVIAITIEISDEDYRTLHLPCDTLEDSGSSKPGS